MSSTVWIFAWTTLIAPHISASRDATHRSNYIYNTVILGHRHENMVELWIVLEGQLDFLIEGEPLVTGTVGDVIQAPNERWHRATSRAPGMATRLAITPRNKEGQMHYYQPDGRGGEN